MIALAQRAGVWLWCALWALLGMGLAVAVTVLFGIAGALTAVASLLYAAAQAVDTWMCRGAK